MKLLGGLLRLWVVFSVILLVVFFGISIFLLAHPLYTFLMKG